nr:hypothetical protein [Klebsiella pneumoniae]
MTGWAARLAFSSLLRVERREIAENPSRCWRKTDLLAEYLPADGGVDQSG